MKENWGTMKKRVITLGLVMAMVTNALAGCSSNTAETVAQTTQSQQSQQGTTSEAKEETTVATEEPVEVSMFTMLGDYAALDTVPLFINSMEAVGIDFKVNSYDRAAVVEKRGILLSTNQYEDVFFKSSIFQDEIVRYGQQGIFIPLNDLIDQYAPNLKAVLEEEPIIKDLISDIYGNIYSLPSIEHEQTGINSGWLNKAWLDRLGLEEPTNIDEFYAMLQAFKTEDANGNGDPNDEIPLMVCSTSSVFNVLFPLFGVKYEPITVTTEKDGKLVHAQTTEEYKEMLRTLAKAYDEGLLNQDCFVNTFPEFQAVGGSGDVVGVGYASGPASFAPFDYQLNYIATEPFEPDVYYKNVGIQSKSLGGLLITDKCENPEKVMEWVDQFYGEEGAILAWLGTEGETFNWTDDAHTTYEWIVPEGETALEMRRKQTLQGDAFFAASKPENFFSASTDPLTQLEGREMKKLVDNHAGDPFPAMNYTDEETKRKVILLADITPYLSEYQAKVIVGDLDLDSSWDSYLETLNKMGMEELTEIYNNAFTR